MYIAHCISLLLYLAIPVMAYVSANKCKRSLHPPALRTAQIFLGATSLLALVFIGLQVDWIVNDSNSSVGDGTAFWWLVFDYLNAISYISGVVLVGMGADLHYVALIRINRLNESIEGCPHNHLNAPLGYVSLPIESMMAKDAEAEARRCVRRMDKLIKEIKRSNETLQSVGKGDV